MTINTLIVDDEKPARDELAFLLKSFPDVHLVGQGKNGVEALALIKEQAFEVNAIDYVLKPIEKNRLARAIQRAKKALEAEASPSERLETLVNQIGSAKTPPVKLLVKTQQRLFLVDAEDVIFASIEDGTITVVTREVEGTSNYRTIEELQSTLESDVFWRAHRSYLVNINHIKEVVPWFKSSYMLKMDDKRASEVPVSRAQTRHLRELLKM
jgi:two-component system LytT family response regulator/two-component system response regulator LytT